MLNKVLTFIVGLSLLGVSPGVFASLPEFPSWTNGSFFQIPNVIEIDGKPVNSIQFKWPKQTGITSGTAAIGFVSPDGQWKEVMHEARWELFGSGDIRLTLESKRPGTSFLDVAPDGHVETWVARQPTEVKGLGTITRLNLQIRYQLEALTTDDLIVSSDFQGDQLSKFIDLRSPIMVNGQSATTLMLDSGTAHFGNVGLNGEFIKTGSSGPYMVMDGFRTRILYVRSSYVSSYANWSIDMLTGSIVHEDVVKGIGVQKTTLPTRARALGVVEATKIYVPIRSRSLFCSQIFE